MSSTLQQFLELDWKQLVQESKDLEEKARQEKSSAQVEYSNILTKHFPDVNEWNRNISEVLISSPTIQAFISYRPNDIFSSRSSNKISGRVISIEPKVTRTFFFNIVPTIDVEDNIVVEKSDLRWDRYTVETVKSCRGYRDVPEKQLEKVLKGNSHLLMGMINLFFENHPEIVDIETVYNKKSQVDAAEKESWGAVRFLNQIIRTDFSSHAKAKELLEKFS